MRAEPGPRHPAGITVRLLLERLEPADGVAAGEMLEGQLLGSGHLVPFRHAP